MKHLPAKLIDPFDDAVGRVEMAMAAIEAARQFAARVYEQSGAIMAFDTSIGNATAYLQCADEDARLRLPTVSIVAKREATFLCVGYVVRFPLARVQPKSEIVTFDRAVRTVLSAILNGRAMLGVEEKR